MNTTGADRKLLALGIKTAKFTAEELEKLIAKFLEGMKNGHIQPDQKTYEDFMQPGGTPLVNAAPNEERETEGPICEAKFHDQAFIFLCFVKTVKKESPKANPPPIALNPPNLA